MYFFFSFRNSCAIIATQFTFTIYKNPHHIIIILIKNSVIFSLQHSVLKTMATLGVSQAPPGFLIPAGKLGNSVNIVNWSISRSHCVHPSSGLTILYLLSDEQWFASCYFIYIVCSSGKVNPILVIVF